MASTSRCPFCDSVVRSDERNCPNCGAENRRFVIDTPATVFRPKTIPELREYCAERGMPLLRMRFFIGEDYPQPKAFGIYQDGENFVVYKNKADGSRAVRYRGPDEAYAVGELYDKLLSECHNRGIYPDGRLHTGSSSSAPTPIDPRSLPTQGESEYRGRQKSGSRSWVKIALIVLAWILLSGLFRSCGGGRSGIRLSGGGSPGYYSDSFRSDSDDDDWDWDSDDTDWDSDW